VTSLPSEHGGDRTRMVRRVTLEIDIEKILRRRIHTKEEKGSWEGVAGIHKLRLRP
jgi:hypothetical protein